MADKPITDDELERLEAALEIPGPKVAPVRALIARIRAAEAERDRLREALEFYANPEVFKPHPHGPAFDKRAFLYAHARAALENANG